MYNWLPTSCTPKEFPVNIISGAFLTLGNDVIGIPEKAYLANGWGATGAISLIGDDTKPIPERLVVIWFSYRERKFYEADSRLPVQTMEQLFRQGFFSPVTRKQETYEYIVVGMAPAGSVSIWLKGNGITSEIAHFKAQEIQVNIKSFIGSAPDLETYVRMVLEEKFTDQEIALVNHASIDVAKWSAAYRTRFNWRINVITTAPVITAIAFFYNGETKFWAASTDTTSTGKLPVPKQLFLSWETLEGNTGVGEISFNETEIFTALNKLSGIGSKMVIQPEINITGNSLEMYVLNDSYVIKLQKCEVEIY